MLSSLVTVCANVFGTPFTMLYAELLSCLLIPILLGKLIDILFLQGNLVQQPILRFSPLRWYNCTFTGNCECTVTLRRLRFYNRELTNRQLSHDAAAGSRHSSALPSRRNLNLRFVVKMTTLVRAAGKFSHRF